MHSETNPCLEPIIKNYHEIVEIVESILESRKLHYKELYLYQSRATGTCGSNSDIDIYVQLSEEHRDLIEKQGMELFGVRVLSPSFFSSLSEDIVNRARALNLDMRVGISDKPPMKDQYKDRKYYIKLCDLKKGGKWDFTVRVHIVACCI